MADNEVRVAESGQKNVVKLKYTTNENSFVISDGGDDENISLQEAFKRYREAKQDELRQARLLRKRQELRKADPQKMAALRQKFVNQAKKYYGYPYARKYWPPDSPEYNSKLFLDCCGLVRRVMRDLADDFGFIIGPWNQSYMYDTLPITVESEKDMKPGDLVFISATYYNPKSRKQRHNMTHVEIWAGEGCKTIGARWNNGKVQLWDSYKFIAKSYHSETYIFKSIDTWLKGICTSFCAQHFWKRSKYSPSKKSIFALPEQIEEDQAAGDDDDNVDSFTVRGNTFCNQVTSVSKMLMQCKVSELPRPKTELDLPNLRGDSPSLNVKQMGSQVDFPTIRNDLKERSKTSCGKKKKGKGSGDGKRKVKSSKTSEKVKKEGKLEKSSIIAWSATSNAPDAVKEIPEDSKELGQFPITGSFNALGRKGLYLRDLVEAQKIGAANDRGDELDNGNEIQDNGDKDDHNENVESEDDDDDNAIGYEDEDDDDDDDYFVFVKEENSDDDGDDKQNEKMMDRNVDGNISDDSSQFIMGEDIESADEKETENIKIDKCLIGDNGLKLNNEFTDKSREEMSDLGVKHDTGNASEDRKETTLDDRVEKTSNLIETIAKDEEIDKMAGCNSNALNNEGKGLEKKITMIDNIMPFASDRESKAVIHGNFNQNAISKTNEKSPTNKHEKARGQCLKASIVTLVSQAGPCGSQSSASQAQVLPSESGTNHSSNIYTQSTGSQGSLATEDMTRSTKSRCSLAAVDNDMAKSSSGVDADSPSETTEEIGGTESGKKGRGKKSPAGAKVTKLPTCSLPSNMTPTFYVGGGNGTSLVEGPLLNIGWKRTTDKFDERFKLKWVECKTRINYGAFKEGEQLVNHLPNSHLLTNKLGLLNSLKEYERVTLSTKGRLPRLRMSDFHPETYKLDEKSDRDLFLEIYKDNEIWICKPVGMNQGKGIFLIRSREAINQLLEEREQKKQQAQKPGRPLMNRIVQRYITKPLLLDKRKFDVRSYMLIASTVPFLILYHKGYVRLCCHKYDPDDLNLGTHLTNQFVQKKDPAYKDIKENTAWSMDKFNEYVNENVRPTRPDDIEEDWVYNTFTKQMQKIMIHCFNSVKHKLQSRLGFFDLFGLDFMVDADMKVHLIEVNTNPALHCNCEALKEVIPGVVEETLYVAIECFEKSKKHQPLMPLQSLKNFTILYCGTRPNTIVPRQSRSVSPVKENSTASEKPKPVAQGALRRTLSPTRQGQRSSMTQSTPMYAARKSTLEKSDSSAANTGLGNKENTMVSNSQNPSASKSMKTAANAKTASSAKSKVDTDSEDKTDDSNEDDDNKLKEEEEIESPKVVKKRGSTVVVDTLSKTTDSLNEATSALGRLSLSLDQGGITDSLLEEVRLKMTHAESNTTANQQELPKSAKKPTSARSRERENLERGN